jgi:hypothetical protein
MIISLRPILCSIKKIPQVILVDVHNIKNLILLKQVDFNVRVYFS